MLRVVQIKDSSRYDRAFGILTCSGDSFSSLPGSGSRLSVNQRQYDMLVAAGVVRRKPKQKSLRGLRECGAVGRTVILEDGHYSSRLWWQGTKVRCVNGDCKCAFQLSSSDWPLYQDGDEKMSFYTVACPHCLYPNMICLDIEKDK